MGLEHPIPQPSQDCVSLCQAPGLRSPPPALPHPPKGTAGRGGNSQSDPPEEVLPVRGWAGVDGPGGPIHSGAGNGSGAASQQVYPRRPAGKRQHCRLRGPGPSAGQARGRSGVLGWVAEAEEGTLRWPNEPPSGRSWRGGFRQGQGPSHNRALHLRPTTHSSKPCRTDGAKLRAQATDSWRSGHLCQFCFYTTIVVVEIEKSR